MKRFLRLLLLMVPAVLAVNLASDPMPPCLPCPPPPKDTRGGGGVVIEMPVFQR